MALGQPIKRRSGDGGCQWLMIGIVLGMGCSLVLFLTAYVGGQVQLTGLEADNSTPGGVIINTAISITATPPPASPSPQVEPPVATEALDTTPDSIEIAQNTSATPGATPLPNGNASPTRLPDSPLSPTQSGTGANTTQSNSTSDIGTAVPIESPTSPPTIGGEDGVPSELASIASPLVAVPGGTFTMGTTREEGLVAVEACITRDGGSCTEEFIQDSTPAHQVTLDDFQMEIYEVSMSQYVAFLNYMLTIVPAGVRPDLAGCGGRPCILTADTEPNSAITFSQGQYEVINPSFNAAHPIIFVTWYGADEYCRAIGRRLPSEAEWERAARGPANSIYPWGPEWVADNANTSRSPGAGENTVDVDSYPNGVSAYGVYNMAGNVSEWVFDFYQENYYALPEAAGPNPKGPTASDSKVARGGGWDNVPLFSRTVHRLAIDPLTSRASVGFRCAANP